MSENPVAPDAPAVQYVYVHAKPPKGNGGLKALLATLSVLLVASVTALALLITGVIASPFAAATPAPPAATGTPTQVFLAPAASAGGGAFSAQPLTNLLSVGSVAQASTGPVSANLVPANPVVVNAASDGAFGMSASVCSRKDWSDNLPAEQADAWLAPILADPSVIWEGQPLSAALLGEYVSQLTTVTLATDTLVTYHTLDGAATTPVPAVLQKGSVVLIDRAGQIRMRCVSGNPITAAPDGILPTYQGEGWPDFDPALVTVIEPAAELLTGLQVRVPATAVGQLVPTVVSNCAVFGAECVIATAGYASPDRPDASGAPVPTLTECAPQNTSTDYSVQTRLHNGSGRDMTVFWVDAGTCNVSDPFVLRNGTAASWSIFPWADFGQLNGAQIVVTDGVSPDVLHRITFATSGEVHVLR